VQIGVVLRNLGPLARRETLVAGARAAEAAGLDHVWVTDHLAIPPDEAEGSQGRYLDPLATLAFLAASTSRIALGTAVLNLPFRPPLPTAKWIATLQELSGGRVRLGVGLGWMEGEFRALGVPRAQRGRLADETLAFLARCFASDEVEANGQRFLFRPRPARPPIYVGGAAPHALVRAARHGDGWLPIRRDAEKLAPDAARLRELFLAAGRGAPEVVCAARLPLESAARAQDAARALAQAGATQLVHFAPYASEAELEAAIEALAGLRDALAAESPAPRVV
jgi:probable F420-dependent oxidoreductase